MANKIHAATGEKDVLTQNQLRLMHAWWRAANYLAVGQIYLLDNPLLQEPLKIEHAMARHRRGDKALHARHRYLGVGEQRSGQ